MRHRAGVVLSFAALGLSACNDAPQPPAFLRVADGEPARGHALIQAYGCGTCHVIEGVRGARGIVGPPLVDYAARKLLAGVVPNAPRYLIPWLIDPPAIAPQTGMPAMGLSETQARHIAAYLYTLGSAQARVYPPDPPLKLDGRELPDLETPAASAASAGAAPRTRRIEHEAAVSGTR